MALDQEQLLRSDTETTDDVRTTWLEWDRSNNIVVGEARGCTFDSSQKDANENDEVARTIPHEQTSDASSTDDDQYFMSGAIQRSDPVRQQVDDYYARADSPLRSSLVIESAEITDDSRASEVSSCLLPYRGDFDGDTGEFEPVGELPTLPKLDFKPFILKDWTLFAIIVFYSGIIAGLATLFYFQITDRVYNVHSMVSRFSIRIMPSLVGTISTMIFQALVTNYSRILPYILMAKPVDLRDDCKRAQTTFLGEYFPTINIFDALKNKNYLLLVAIVNNNVLNIFITPTKSTLIRRTPSPGDPDSWKVTVSEGSAAYLLFAYTVSLLIVLAMFIKLWKIRTGLKWDPVSIADQLMLLQGSDVLDDFTGLEYLSHAFVKTRSSENRQFTSLRHNRYRLGYWHHRPTNRYWHGIRRWSPRLFNTSDQDHARPKTAVATYPVHDEYEGDLQLKSSLRPGQPTASRLPPDQLEGLDVGVSSPWTNTNFKDSSWWQNKREEIVRDPSKCYYYVYMWISDYAATAAYGLVAVSVVASIWIIVTGRLIHGFVHSADDFELLYFFITFVVTLWFMSINNFWYFADLWYRQLQVFMGLRQPAAAQENLLLGYACDLPIVITIKALAACHWRLAFVSALAVIHRLLPVLAGSVLNITPASNPQYILITVDPGEFKAVFGYLCAYLILIPIVWPGLDRRLPFVPRCLADPVTMFYDSTLIHNPIFMPHHMDEKRWHMKYRLCLAERKYAFGVYPGSNNEWHLGIDDASGYDEDQHGSDYVTPLRPPVRIHRRWLKCTWDWAVAKFSSRRKLTSSGEVDAQERLHDDTVPLQATTTAVELVK